ncbi:membrane protein [Clostridia bacterium]|nr:membrane protein [Clostridia bacterium]
MNQEIITEQRGFFGLTPGLSGNAVKMIGVILMVFDHLHQMFGAQGAPDWFSMLGRLVLPIFLFMCAEGFYYTRSRKRYLLLLLIGIWVMSTFNYILTEALPFGDLYRVELINNVFTTLFMVAFYLLAIETLRGGIREKKPRKVLGSIGLLIAPILASVVFTMLLYSENPAVMMASIRLSWYVPNILMTEGGFTAVIMGIAFYYLRNWRWAQMVPLAVLSLMSFTSGGDSIQWMMIFAAIPILLYNGQRGGGNKYFFYIFYPAHIYAFYIIAWMLQK